MRYDAKADKNQPEIVEALRMAGCVVQHLHTVGRGVPDLLVSKHGVNYLIEVKTEDGELTKAEKEWIEAWDAPVYIARSIEEALEAVGCALYAVYQHDAKDLHI